MELGEGWQDLGLLGLFLASFLAATVLPFSSEAVLLAMLFGPWSPMTLWACASAGNWLGGMSSYGLGRLADWERIAKWSGTPQEKVERIAERVRQWGPWSALLSWLPVLGDPISVALGVFRVPWVPVSLLMFVGKAARYAILILAALGFLSW